MEALIAMLWTGWKIRGLLLLGVLCSAGVQLPARAQGAAAPQTSLSDEFASLASRAALVFSGQVVSIARKSGVVEVTFRVDQSVVGAPGRSFTLREWSGLWPAGQFRYTVGERALVFLHGVSAAGFASSVDGANGIVPVVVQGANTPQLLDIRRLAAAIRREPGTPLPTEAEGAIQLSEAMVLVQSASRASGVTLGTGRLKPGYRLPFRRLPLKGSVSGLDGVLGGASSSPFEPLPLQRVTDVVAGPKSPRAGDLHVAQ